MPVESALLNELRHLVAREFDVPPESIKADTHFFEHLDESLQLAETVMKCEERWDLTIPDSAFMNVTTFGQLADVITGLLEAKNSAER